MFYTPLLGYIIYYFGGIAFFRYFNLVSLFCFLCFILFLWRNRQREVRYFVFFFLLGFFIAVLFSWCQERKATTFNNLKVNAPIKFKIVSDVVRNGNKLSFYVKYKKLKIKSYLKVFGDDFYEYGDILTCQNFRLAHLKKASNPGLTIYDDYLKLQKVSGKLYLKESNIVNYYKPNFSLIRTIFRIKNKLVAIHQKTLPDPYANILSSIIFGTSAAPLSREIQDQYKRVGVIHLLVVSGSQIAILVGVAILFSEKLKLSPKQTFWLTSFFNVAFTIATGGGASILRACIMAEITLFAKLIGRHKEIYTALGFSAFLMSIVNPYVIFDIGFQLSYAATISLVYLVPKIEIILGRFFNKAVRQILSVSIAPFLLTTPLAVFYFNGFSVVSLLMNLIVITWVESLVVLGFLATLLGVVWLPLAKIINLFNLILLVLLEYLVRIFNAIPFAYLYVRQFNVFVLLAVFVFLILSVEFLVSRKEKYRKILLVVIIFICSNFVLGFVKNDLSVTMFDVGQGDSILIETPKKKAILVDCGNESYGYDPGESVLFPYFIKKGIDKIDYLIITHAHADHYSGVASLIDKIRINHVLVSPAVINNSSYQKLIFKMKAKGIDIIKPDIFDVFFVDNVSFCCLYPGVDIDISNINNINNTSLVYLMEYSDFKMLFTGDVEQEGELAINGLEDIDILKVAHHGSQTSSSKYFLENTLPEFSLVSVGEKNKFKHPNMKTISLLAQYGDVYRTDHDGAIKVIVDKGGKYRVDSVL